MISEPPNIRETFYRGEQQRLREVWTCPRSPSWPRVPSSSLVCHPILGHFSQQLFIFLRVSSTQEVLRSSAETAWVQSHSGSMCWVMLSKSLALGLDMSSSLPVPICLPPTGFLAFLSLSPDSRPQGVLSGTGEGGACGVSDTPTLGPFFYSAQIYRDAFLNFPLVSTAQHMV